MATIAILGAGLGGVLAAYEVKAKARPEDRVVLISKGETYHFTPSNPWVAVGWRAREAVEINLPPVMKRKGVEFIATGARRLHPAENRIELDDGASLAYDYLVIATGPDLAFDEIEGLGPEGFTQSICHVDHAERAFRRADRPDHRTDAGIDGLEEEVRQERTPGVQDDI